MNWTEPKKPTEGISHYDHTICKTPIGELKIEWKSWKVNDSYDIMLNDSDWIGSGHDLESAKEIAKNYLVLKHKELSEFLGTVEGCIHNMEHVHTNWYQCARCGYVESRK